MKKKNTRYFIPIRQPEAYAYYKKEGGSLYYYSTFFGCWRLSYTSINCENYKEVKPEEFILYAGFL